MPRPTFDAAVESAVAEILKSLNIPPKHDLEGVIRNVISDLAVAELEEVKRATRDAIKSYFGSNSHAQWAYDAAEKQVVVTIDELIRKAGTEDLSKSWP